MSTPNPIQKYLEILENGAPDESDEMFSEILGAREAEVTNIKDLEQQRGTPIPLLFNQLYKYVQNPSSISVETYKRMIDTDDTIGSGVDFLTSCLVARRGMYVHPSQEITEFVNKALSKIEGGWMNTGKEQLSATWAGFYVGEKVWANTPLGFIVKKLVSLPPSTILFEVERTGSLTRDGILQYQRNWSPMGLGRGMGYFGGTLSLGLGFAVGDQRPDVYAKLGDLPFPLRTANPYSWMSIRIPRQKCVHYAFDAQGKFGNPYGRSLLRRAYKYYVIKDAILQMMSIALDRKGTPLTIVYADPNTTLQDPNKDADAKDSRGKKGRGISADKAAQGAFKNIHNDSVIILPGKEGEIYKVTELGQQSNAQDFIAALDFCNKSILRALMIPALIFGTGDGSGSWALGEQHQKTFDKICDAMLEGANNVLLQDLIYELIAYNFPASAWEKDGLGGFSKRELTQDERSKEMEVFEKGIDKGIIDQQDLSDLNKMREAIGFEPRDKVIERPDPLGLGAGEEGEGGAPGDNPAPGKEGKGDESAKE